VGVRVDERVSIAIPQRPVFVPFAGVDEVVVVGPPHLVVGGGDDLAGDLVGDRARRAACRCGAPRFCGSTVGKYWTSHPRTRRRFCITRSTSAEKWMASRARVGSFRCLGPRVRRCGSGP